VFHTKISFIYHLRSITYATESVVKKNFSLSLSLYLVLLGICEYKDTECPIAKVRLQQPQQQEEMQITLLLKSFFFIRGKKKLCSERC
jgi:hypothetical protein